jgi:hypothetical protein
MRVGRAKDPEERERRLGMRLLEEIVSAGISRIYERRVMSDDRRRPA